MRKMNLHKMNLLKMTGALIIAFVFAFALIPSVTASASDGNYHKSGNSFTNPNNGASYQWMTRSDGAKVLFKNGSLDSNEFVSDGTYTYYCQADGTVMKDRFTYHPDGEHMIYFDSKGHEIFNAFAHPTYQIGDRNLVPDGDQYYFNVHGYMYKNTVTYDVTGTKLYYIDPNGCMQHSGWFTFDESTTYGGDGSEIWELTATMRGFAQFDGSLLINIATTDEFGRAVYMQGNGEAVFIVTTPDENETSDSTPSDSTPSDSTPSDSSSDSSSTDSSNGSGNSGTSGVPTAEQPLEGRIVYITNTGKRYHEAGCRMLIDSCIPISYDEAIEMGYTPCGICH